MKTFKINIKNIPKISIQEYLVLFYLYSRDFDLFEELVDNIDDFESVKSRLEEEQLIKVTGDNPKEWILRSKTTCLFKDINNNYKIGAEEIFNYYKSVHDKYSGKKSKIKFSTNKDFLIKRIKNGVSLDGAKAVIKYKFKEWWDTEYRKHLNSFATLLGATHYNNYLTQAELNNEEDDEAVNDSINRMI